MTKNTRKLKGRGAKIRPPNRFETVRLEDDFEQIENDEEFGAARNKLGTVYLPDDSQSILSHNDSPDVGFRWSINPYRGCEHGCAYCYARPTHEYLGLDAGLDFESRILIKHEAPQLLRRELAKRSWRGEVIALSGVTDCYQPAERQFRLTRGCLEVMLAARQAFGIVTKNALVTRDLDVLQAAAELRLVHVNISVTSLDAELVRAMEPRTSLPAQRLDAIRRLVAAGIPVRVLAAPIIPGLNDQEIPAILRAVSKAGAASASHVLLRLPWAVRPIFRDWLARSYPDKAARIETLIRSTRHGELNNTNFNERMRGAGEYAEQIARTMKVFRRKFGLDRPLPDLDETLFERPELGGQQRLF